MAKLTSNNDPKPLTPPAVWTAFARQGAWKNWVLALQFFVIFLLALLNFSLSRRPPDVVLIDPAGKSTYVQASLAPDALVRWIQEQKLTPTDVTLIHFTREFLTLALGIDSDTIASTWPETLSLMSPPLSDRLSKQAIADKLIETTVAAKVKSVVSIDDVDLVKRTTDFVHIRAKVTRVRTSLVNPNKDNASENLVVDLVLKIVPRSLQHPDALEVAEWTTTATPGTANAK